MMPIDVLDPTLLTDLGALARAVPGVDDAAAVVRRGVRRDAAAVSAPTPDPVAVVDDPDAPPADLDGGPVRVPADAPGTLQQALRAAAQMAPDKGTVFITKGNDDVMQTYPELLDEAQRTLAGLRAAGLRPGDAALFVFDDNRAYLTAFWACVLGGFVPAPVAVATTYQALNDMNRRLHNVWRLLKRPVLLTDTATAPALAGVRALWGEPDVRIHVVGDLLRCAPDTRWHPVQPEDPVLHLLTSGSTGVPKCVQHTHATVVARSLAYAQHSGMGGDEVSLIWMPYDHVTVVHCNIRDVFLRCMHVNAKIEHFLADPLLWLDWADRYRATNTWAPNFAFAMVNERADEIATRSWDLSRFRQILNGGEPVVAATSHRFLELLAPYGLPADAMVPAWGMAETCSGVTYGRQRRDQRAAGTVTLDPASLAGTIREVDPEHQDAVVISTVGRPIPGVRVRVVDDSGAVLPERRLGELWIRGSTVMTGYFDNPDANREAFVEDGWFRTGDLAFVRDGELVIAGRKKDQIIVRGVNYLAHELESVVEQVAGVRVTFTGAAAVREPGAGSDRLAIFFVPTRWDTDALAGIADAIRAVLVREVGLAPDLLVPVTEAEFPKTNSGKIQRAALVAALRAGTFAGRVIGGAAEAPVDTWFCTRQWADLPAAGGAGAASGADRAEQDAAGVRVVISDDADLVRLRMDGRVVAVQRGDGFTAQPPDRYRAAVTDRAALARLLRAVSRQHGKIATIVLALPPREGDPAARLREATAEVGALVGVLADGEFGDPLLLLLTSGAVHVDDGDRVDLGTCALPALVRTAVSENPRLRVRQLDLPADVNQWSAALAAELADHDHVGVVAARRGRRLHARLVPVVDAEGLPGQPVRAGGVYLVTGGLGGIGHDLAGYLLADYGVRLLIVGRSAATGTKADRLAELAALGQVRYEQVDVADVAALRAAVTAAEVHWGRPLDGVLHLAGADPTAQWADLDQHLVARETAGTYDEQYRPKVTGTLAVAAVLADRPRASLVLFGSVNGEFGGHSFGAYAAANGFLVGFADHWRHERGRSVHCLVWGMWTTVGMNRDQASAPAVSRGFRPIDPTDGLRRFLTALALPQHYLLIGLDLDNPAIIDELAPDRLHAGELVVAYAGRADAATVGAALSARTGDCPVPVRLARLDRIPRNTDGGVDGGRLLLDTAPRTPRRSVVAPATELECQVAALWSEALDRPQVGRDESFFDLGGNSLRATRLLAVVNDKLGVRVTTQELYENPTVAAMAATVAEREGNAS